MIDPNAEPVQYVQVARMAVLPARVQAAMALLHHLADCECPAASPSMFGGESSKRDGRELLPVEQETRAVAHKMLQAYFLGSLGMTWFETEKPNIDQHDVVDCPMCDGGKQKTVGGSCRMCRDKGKVIFMGTVK